MAEVVSNTVIVAVSGGIDSVVLLDILSTHKQALVVAHVNHGIRPDSNEDEQFVKDLAKSYELPFTSTRLHLHPAASENTARQARYEWLEKVRAEHRASTIVTAHHQDDVLETMVINMIRGTGWRGLSSLRSTANRYRPLLQYSKAEIVAYALGHRLSWREDSTNDSFKYLRNRVRGSIIPRLTTAQRQQLLTSYETQSKLRTQIDDELEQLLAHYVNDRGLRRYPLCMVDDNVAYEILRAWLGEALEQSRMRELLLFAKVAKKGAKWSLDSNRFIVANSDHHIVLSPRD